MPGMPAPDRFDLLRDDPGAAQSAALAALDRGELVIVPTETVYGVAAREDRPAALERLAELKSHRQRPFSVAVSSLEMIRERLTGVPVTALPLMRRWWPGPLTLVLGLAPEAQDAGNGTLGVRVPGHAWTRELIAAAGVPLLLPSANLPDAPAPVAVGDLDPAVLSRVAVVVDGGRAALGEASTLVQPLLGGLRVLREGVVSRADLVRHALPRTLVVCSGNTCRSPMAELLLRRALQEHARRDPALLPPSVTSRGLHVHASSPATNEAVLALEELGLDLSDHESRPMDVGELRQTSVVLCMTGAHRRSVLAALDGVAGPRVESFDASGDDVEDPFGGPVSEYRVVARRLAELAAEWANRLMTPETSR